MNNGKSLHQKLLVASYILGSISTLLGALAAIGATMEQGNLQYPNVNSDVDRKSTLPNKQQEPNTRYFEL